MEYSVVNKIEVEKSRCRKIGPYLYDPLIDGLYLEMPYPFPVQLMVSHNLTHCQVTPMFKRLPFILKGWINLDILLREIDLIKLVERNGVLLHASCVNKTLIVGFPNSGKTYQTYRMVADGEKLISEEYTIIWSGLAYSYKDIMRSCFSARTIKDCGLSLSVKEKLWLMGATLRAKMMPFMFEAVIWKEVRACGDVTEIKEIRYGSTGEGIRGYKDLIILTENEFPFMANEFLQAYALATGFDLVAVQNKQRKLIKEFYEYVYPDSKS